MSSRKYNALLLLVAVVGISAALLTVPAALRGQPNAGVHLTFQGTTNLVWPGASGRFAAFQLHNETGTRIMYVPESLEVRTESGWVTNQCSGKVPTNWWNLECILSDRDKHVFLVPPPSTNQSWLIRLTCFEKATGLRGLGQTISDLKENLHGNGAKYESFGGNRLQVVSPVVNS